MFGFGVGRQAADREIAGRPLRRRRLRVLALRWYQEVVLLPGRCVDVRTGTIPSEVRRSFGYPLICEDQEVPYLEPIAPQ